MKGKRDPIADLVSSTGRPRDEIVEFCKERSAIREHSGGFSRADADRLALEDAEEFFAR